MICGGADASTVFVMFHFLSRVVGTGYYVVLFNLVEIS